MTQAERLIRNLCDSTRASVQTEASRAKAALGTGHFNAPAAIKTKALRLLRLRQEARELERQIERAGFAVRDRGGVDLAYTARQEREAKIFARRDAQLAAIKALEAAAIVATLDARGAAAKPHLIQLQQALTQI